MEDVLAIVMVFGTGMLGIIAFSPIGKAIAERLRGRHAQDLPHEQLEDMREELQSLREQVSELHERQDFNERLLAQVKEKGVIGGGAAP